MSKHQADRVFSVSAPKARYRPYGLIACAAALLVYVVASYFIGELAPWLLPIAALLCAGLATSTFLLATRRRESAEEMLYRLRRMQHSDFGKQLLQNRPKPRTLKLPGSGEVSLRSLGAAGVFAVVCLWWLTPLAPIHARRAEPVDLTIPFGEEIAAAVLVLPSGQIALFQPPVPPRSAKQAAWLIRQDADAYHRALRAMAEGRSDEARPLLTTAERDPDADVAKIQLARAQNEMFACNFRAAAADYEKLSEQQPDDLLTLCQAAAAWLQAGELSRAESIVARAVKISKEKDARRASVMHLQALLAVAQGKDLDRAQELFRQSQELLPEPERDRTALFPASLNDQAVLYVLRGDYPGAFILLDGAEKIWTRNHGEAHPLVAATEGNLGLLEILLGRYSHAEQRLENALEVRQDSLDQDHLGRAASLNATAIIHRVTCQYEESRRYAEEARVLVEKELGGDHRELAPILMSLGDLCLAESRFAQADGHYNRALLVAKKAWNPQHPYVAAVLNHLARLYLATGRYDESAKAAQQALEIDKRTYGAKHIGVAAALATLGRVEIARDHASEARKFLSDALEIDRAAYKSFGKNHPEIAQIIGDRAALTAYPGCVDDYEHAIKMAQACLGEEHPEVARLWFGLAKLHVSREKLPEAEQALKQALAIQDKVLQKYNHPDLAATLELYAEVLAHLTPPRTEEAAAMRARAKTIRQKHAAEDRADLGRTGSVVLTLCVRKSSRGV